MLHERVLGQHAASSHNYCKVSLLDAPIASRVGMPSQLTRVYHLRCQHLSAEQIWLPCLVAPSYLELHQLSPAGHSQTVEIVHIRAGKCTISTTDLSTSPGSATQMPLHEQASRYAQTSSKWEALGHAVLAILCSKFEAPWSAGALMHMPHTCQHARAPYTHLRNKGTSHLTSASATSSASAAPATTTVPSPLACPSAWPSHNLEAKSLRKVVEQSCTLVCARRWPPQAPLTGQAHETLSDQQNSSDQAGRFQGPLLVCFNDGKIEGRQSALLLCCRSKTFRSCARGKLCGLVRHSSAWQSTSLFCLRHFVLCSQLCKQASQLRCQQHR